MARFSLRTLRNGLLVVAALLVLVVGGFIGYAHYRLTRFALDLPGRLGMHVTQESDNITYSQTVDKRTIFTVHAAKQVDHGGGKYTLHDVGIILYGRQADRADRIHGSEFEYDQKNGIMRAVGDCFIDLAAPAPGAGRPGKQPSVPGLSGGVGVSDDARLIHVKTSGLVFVQKDRTASTDQPVEFMAGGSTGSSIGAAYDSAAGVLVLRSAVKVSGLRGEREGKEGSGHPLVLTAARAEMDRTGNVVKLEDAMLVGATKNGAQTMAAEHAIVHTSEDGTPQLVDAQGKVTLTGDRRGSGHDSGRDSGQGVVTADRMELELNDSGQPRHGHLFGGVRYVENGALRQRQGQASDAQVAFDAQGRPVHATIMGGVEMEEKAAKNERRLNAAKVELALSGGGKERVLLRGAVASGADGAMLRTLAEKADRSSTANGLRADALTARFAEDAPAKGLPAGTHLVGLDGRGRSYLEQVVMDANGSVASKETSTGETLQAEFGPSGDKVGRTVLTRAVQRGAVNVVRETRPKSTAAGVNAKPASASVQHARADVATYDNAADRLLLTGSVAVTDAESGLFADRVESDRGTGDSTADGAVRVSYLQQGSAGEPVHVLAARAISHKATGMTEFFAAPGGRAKMWQGGSQVEAPVLDFNRTAKTLVAKDEHGADAAVRAVLVDAGDGSRKDAGKASEGPIRVVSREMTYLDGTREVEFRGHVRVDDRDGTMRAQEATVFLTAAPVPAAASAGAAGAAAPMTLGGRVDHLVGTGAVEIEQPGRKATGERLTYTASDQTFVLTGSRSDPPRVVDQAQGTVTGASLRFRTGDDSVTVSGTEAGAETRRVRSETRIKQQ